MRVWSATLAEEDAKEEVWDAKREEGRCDIVVGSVIGTGKQARRSDCFYIVLRSELCS